MCLSVRQNTKDSNTFNMFKLDVDGDDHIELSSLNTSKNISINCKIIFFELAADFSAYTI